VYDLSHPVHPSEWNYAPCDANITVKFTLQNLPPT
jgi:hypothetical protein